MVGKRDMITLAEYQRFTRTTAVYDLADGIDYCLLGLVGEYVEWCEVCNLFDGVGMAAELGDICWYLSELATHLNIDIDRVMAFEDWHRDTPTLITTIGTLCQMRKREIRDSKAMDVKRASELIASALIYINRHSPYVDGVRFRIYHVLELNRTKLTQRQANNTLHGEGDKR